MTRLPVHEPQTGRVSAWRIRVSQKLTPPYLYLFSSFSPATLPFLFQTLFLIDEGLAPLILQLVQVALSGIPPESTTTGKEHSGKEGGGRKGGKHEAKREGKEKKELKESKPASPTPGEARPSIFLSFPSSLLLVFLFSPLSFLPSSSSS